MLIGEHLYDVTLHAPKQWCRNCTGPRNQMLLAWRGAQQLREQRPGDIDRARTGQKIGINKATRREDRSIRKMKMVEVK